MANRIAILLVILFVTQGVESSEKRIPETRPKAPTIFVFHTDEFWLNLNHFLYVLGRAENKSADAAREAVMNAPADQVQGFTKLNAKEQAAWREIVTAYATSFSKKDLVFDESASTVTKALAGVADSKSLKGVVVDPALAALLERAAPIYRKAWWTDHRKSNRGWQKMIEPLLAKHGAAILKFLTNAYQLDWPAEGYPVHLSGYSNWAGAYSTRGSLLVVSSLAEDTTGAMGLETIFHEGMHQWDDAVQQALREQTRQQKKRLSPGISHALIFYTAGDAVRRVVPGHEPYAEKFGLWKRGIGPFKEAIEKAWKPYLDGNGTRDEAFAALIKLAPEAPSR
jgi:hypothetical protein